MNWYVVNTHSGYENKAKLALEDAIARATPSTSSERSLSPPSRLSKCVTVEEDRRGKVIPGYMFVQMDLDNESFHVVRLDAQNQGASVGVGKTSADARRRGSSYHESGGGRRTTRPLVVADFEEAKRCASSTDRSLP